MATEVSRLLEISNGLSPADTAVLTDWPNLLLRPVTLEAAKLFSLAPDSELIRACGTGFRECTDPDAALELGTRLWRTFEVAETPKDRSAVAEAIKLLIPINQDLRLIGENLGAEGRPWILAASRMYFPPCKATVGPGNSKVSSVLIEPTCVSGPSSPLRITVNVWKSPDSTFIAATLTNMTSTLFSDIEVFILGQRITLPHLKGFEHHTIRLRHPLDSTGFISIRSDFSPSSGKRYTERCLSIDF